MKTWVRNSKRNEPKRRWRVWRKGRNGLTGKALHMQPYFQENQSESRAKPAEKSPPKYYLYGQSTPNSASEIQTAATAVI